MTVPFAQEVSISTTEPVATGRRVHWLELFFDLVIVAYIGQIAHTIHGDPSWLELAQALDRA